MIYLKDVTPIAGGAKGVRRFLFYQKRKGHVGINWEAVPT